MATPRPPPTIRSITEVNRRGGGELDHQEHQQDQVEEPGRLLDQAEQLGGAAALLLPEVHGPGPAHPGQAGLGHGQHGRDPGQRGHHQQRPASRPGSARSRPLTGAPARQQLVGAGLHGPLLLGFGVVEAAQVEDAVHGQQLQLGGQALAVAASPARPRTPGRARCRRAARARRRPPRRPGRPRRRRHRGGRRRTRAARTARRAAPTPATARRSGRRARRWAGPRPCSARSGRSSTARSTSSIEISDSSTPSASITSRASRARAGSSTL